MTGTLSSLIITVMVLGNVDLDATNENADCGATSVLLSVCEYGFGMNVEKEQETFHPYLYLTLLILILITAIYFPVHWVMKRFAPSPGKINQTEHASAAPDPNSLPPTPGKA